MENSPSTDPRNRANMVGVTIPYAGGRRAAGYEGKTPNGDYPRCLSDSGPFLERMRRRRPREGIKDTSGHIHTGGDRDNQPGHVCPNVDPRSEINADRELGLQTTRSFTGSHATFIPLFSDVLPIQEVRAASTPA